MNYDDAIEFLDSRIRFGIRPGTERVAALVEALNEPQHTYPVVHVSGTNGKFSTLAIATAILGELGSTVGNYTSPHLSVVRERISFGLEPIDEETFASVLTYLVPYIDFVEERMGDQLTYFELLTAMAFEAFFDRPVHVAVIETGLGGEYDATNVADARVAVVTNVTHDHVRQFGGDLVKAAWEKAGIAKEGTTVIVGVEEGDLFQVVERRALEKGAASVIRVGRDVDVIDRRPGVGGQLISIRGVHASYDDVFVPLYGPHQARNALLAVAACEAFAGEALDHDSLERGLAAAQTPGRIEVLARQPLVVADGGHNPAAAEAVKATLREAFAYERLILVIGMLSEKLIEDVLAIWAPVIDSAVVTAPPTDRAADPDRLASELRRLGVSDVEVIGNVGQAVESARSRASDDDLVLVFGSFHTVGDARDTLNV